VHHRPAGPPVSARLTGALTRWVLLLRGVLRLRLGRLVLAGLVTTAITGLVLAVPVIAGGGTGSPPVVLDSSSSTSPGADDAVTLPPSSAAPGTATAPSPTPAPRPPAGGASAPSPLAPSVVPDGATADPTPPPAPAPAPAPAPSTEASATSAAPTPDATPLPVTSADLGVGELLGLLDEARTAAGCDPLTADAALTATAEAHSAAMRDGDFFGLLGADGQSPLGAGARAAAIARGLPAFADVVEEWLADPSTAAAVDDCALTSAGIGRAAGDAGPWWTLLLA
jgi:uncharacterized protein YkwD